MCPSVTCQSNSIVLKGGPKSCAWLDRCQALEERLEAMRAERRPAGGAPADLLAQHAAEVDSLNTQLASLKVSLAAESQIMDHCSPTMQNILVSPCAGLILLRAV